MIDYKAQGKKNRLKGAAFEREIRKHFESLGWTVDKFTNNIDLENSCIIPAKTNRFMSRSCGFPDFIMFRKTDINLNDYDLMLVECKCNGTLNKTEKLKMEWLKNEGFNCWVASKKGTSLELKRPSEVRRKNIKD